jgi:hypothetical protein
MTELHETPLGRRFFEHTHPELVRQVSRLADAVERLADTQVRVGTPEPGGPTPPQGDIDDPED